MRHLARLFGFVTSIGCLPLLAQPGTVIISQIYGGGGNSSAPYQTDFVELLNRTDQPIDLTGWTVQYAASAGSSWDRTTLSGALAPGQYYLVQEHMGTVGAAPGTPDAVGGINLSATSGKVALVSNSTVLSGTSPAGAHIIDFVGYGSANAAEGSPAPSLTNTTAARRRSQGCTDTNNNSADFTTGNPQPRNRQSPTNLCVTPQPATPTISSAGISNAASYAGGRISPGEIVTIFGSNLGPAALQTLQLDPDGRMVTTSLAGTRVLFAGTPAPVIYSRADQVSVVVPYSVAARPSVGVQVEYNGMLSNTVEMAVAEAVPGIFTADSSGRGQGAIQNQDYSTNEPSRPAAQESIIIIYATGAGETDPIAPDGAVIGAPYPTIRRPVSVRIDGVNAEVLYAGMAPGLVNGVLQINARVPETLQRGGSLPLEIQIGDAVGQAGVTVFVEGPPGDLPGTGPLIEQRLRELRTTAVVPALPEIPNDRIGLPPNWLGLVSWNIQVGGTSAAAGAARPPMVKVALSSLFGGTYGILAAQEIPNTDSADLLTGLLPGGTVNWHASFVNTTDSMDNGFWFRRGTVLLRDAFPLNVTDLVDNAGTVVADPERAAHPPEVAQFEAGDFDFTMLTVHLTFADGNTAESARELRLILDYLDWYFTQPDHDPDVIVCGDFNMPSALSGQTGRGGLTLDSVFQSDDRFQTGERRFVVTVHEPTSRSPAANGGTPVSNYDHCVLSADVLEEFIQARRVDTAILTDQTEDPEVRLTSDHFPIIAFFRTTGPGILLDRKLTLRPNP